MPESTFVISLKLAKPAKVEIDEKLIQQAFEGDLSLLEEGLRKVASFLRIGTGIIDTLAVDDEGVPVFIEYKKPGDFDKDALVQLMEYYSWFVTDQNHLTYLKDVISQVHPELSEIPEDIRLIAVVADVKDRVKNACWALSPDIKLVTYSIFESGNASFGIVPKVIVDTSEGIETQISPPKTEEWHLQKCEQMRPVYQELKNRILSFGSDVTFNAAPKYYVAAMRGRIFCTFRFKKKWINLDIDIDPELQGTVRLAPAHRDGWGRVQISSIKDIDDQLMNWLRTGYDGAPQKF